eukprot:XP_011510497.1 T-cell-specific surface glycoprotein CD28 isoform X2 [Homo sapiens]
MPCGLSALIMCPKGMVAVVVAVDDGDSQALAGNKILVKQSPMLVAYDNAVNLSYNEKSNGTIIHVKGKHLCPSPLFPGPSKPFWVLVVVGGVLACYSLLVTVAFIIFWVRSKRSRLLHSDYMNMTPRRPGPTRKHYQPYAPPRDFAAYRS